MQVKMMCHPKDVDLAVGDNCNNTNVCIARLGEAYLLYAEACLASGNNAEALKYVNKIQERVGSTLYVGALPNSATTRCSTIFLCSGMSTSSRMGLSHTSWFTNYTTHSKMLALTWSLLLANTNTGNYHRRLSRSTTRYTRYVVGLNNTERVETI